MLTFQRFDPSECRFPAPRVPLLPVLRRDGLGWRRDAATLALDGAGVRHFSRGRYAMHEAYRAAGVGPEGALLVPAYHCRTMFDPALALGGNVLFYAVDEQLTPNLASIITLLAGAAPKVSALLVTHYFGLRQPHKLMDALVALYQHHGITLVEDCSHAWQVALEQGPACATQAGRMVVGSSYKFFASPDGGTLWGNPAELGAPSSAPGPLAELKALFHTMTRARAGSTLGVVAAGAATARGVEHSESGAPVSSKYQRGEEGSGALALSRLIVRHSRMDAAAAQRRARYRQWLDATSALAGARPLFSALPPDCVPYMFPLLIRALDPHFFQIKQLGMPVGRWDDVAVSNCGVAAKMRLHLLHLPCHQSLSDSQMDWMTTTVARMVAA